MSTVSLHNRIRVQRLRGKWPDMPLPSGSRGIAPGILRSLLSLCCSNPRRGFVSPADWGWQVLPVRLCECDPCQIATVKSGGYKQSGEIPAKIAAFRVKASGQCALSLPKQCSNRFEARAGTFPPFIQRVHGPPSACAKASAGRCPAPDSSTLRAEEILVLQLTGQAPARTASVPSRSAG